MGKNGALSKNNPARIERDRTIAEERLKGKTYRELSEQFGLSKSHLHQILHDDAVKDVIQTGTKEMIALVPKAVDNYKELLDSKDQKIKLQASKDCLQTTGIMPSHTPSPVVVNILNQQAVPEQTEEIKALGEFLRHRMEMVLAGNKAVVDKKAVDEI